MDSKDERKIIDELLKKYDEVIVKKVQGTKQYIGIKRKLEATIREE